MHGVNFPIEKTKAEGVSKTFDLSSPEDRKVYFEAKAGPEIEKLRNYLKDKTFVAFLLGKKNSGKGTYSKLFMEIVGAEHVGPVRGPLASNGVGHLSVGDVVRDVHEVVEEKGHEYESLKKFLEANFRGFHSVEEVDDIILGRSTATLLSSELTIALIKWEISRRPRQALFIDGFPRGFDQINYTLFFKEIIGYQGHPDFFVFIDVPNSVIDERIKYRVICPVCKTPRSTKLLATKNVGWDEEKKEFYLMCDTPTCEKARLVAKEGDELGIEPIKARLETEEKVFKELLKLQGIPKIYLRNSVPVDKAPEYADEYELTPEYVYEKNADNSVKVSEKPWAIADDNGVMSYSLMPAAIVVSLVRQVSKVLGL